MICFLVASYISIASSVAHAPGPEGTNDCVGRFELPENASEVTHLYETTETRQLIDPNFGSRRDLAQLSPHLFRAPPASRFAGWRCVALSLEQVRDHVVMRPRAVSAPTLL